MHFSLSYFLYVLGCMSLAHVAQANLKPCAFIAVDYVLLQKLADSLGEEAAKDCLYLRSSLIVKLFVWSDFITFNVQADGAGLEANDKLDKIGSSVSPLFPGILLDGY